MGAVALVCFLPSTSRAFMRCRGSAGLKNLWVDALTDPISCIGPKGQLYPHHWLCCWRGTTTSVQVNLQHDGTHVWSEPHLRPTCHYRPKVPRLAPASHL